MKSGGWDLSTVDMDALKESKLALVFGQMNELPEQEQELPFRSIRCGVFQGW